MTKPVLLAALPSSGSAWIADCYAAAYPDQRCTREFFSATYNWRMAKRLEQDCGDMMLATIPLLTTSLDCDRVERLLQDTWGQVGFEFTKECHLAWSLESFAEFFECIVLVRSFASTFPPQRARVIRWYEHLYWSLAMNDLLDEFCMKAGETPTTRAAIAHYFGTRRLCEAAKNIGTKVVVSDELSFPDRYHELEVLAKSTVKTIARPAEHLECWRDAFDLHDLLESKYGKAVR
jgi:hypothetical protein